MRAGAARCLAAGLLAAVALEAPLARGAAAPPPATSPAAALSEARDGFLALLGLPAAYRLRLDQASVTLGGVTQRFELDARVRPGSQVSLRLTLDGGARPAAVLAVSAAPRAPVTVNLDAADLAHASVLTPWPHVLRGQARLGGELSGTGPLAFRGSLEAPRLQAFGMFAETLRGPVRLQDGVLSLQALDWRQYGGTGHGWAEAPVDGRAAPMRAEVRGEGIDLAALAQSWGATGTRVTGRVRYHGGAQAGAERGVTAVIQVASETGGSVDVEILEALLASEAVRTESTGLLRRTLENLRAFEYESLEGEIRWRDGAGHTDLTLKGRKRFGIFPGPVAAINIRNMPLSVLVRTVGRGSTP